MYFHFLLIYITTDNDQCLTIGRKDVRKLKISKAKIFDIGKSFRKLGGNRVERPRGGLTLGSWDKAEGASSCAPRSLHQRKARPRDVPAQLEKSCCKQPTIWARRSLNERTSHDLKHSRNNAIVMSR